MRIAGPELENMLALVNELQHLLASGLKTLVCEHQKLLARGEILWEQGVTNAKFGCLGYDPRESHESNES